MKRAFMTGATGFVGAAVARALVAAGWQVRALARPNSDRRNLSGLPLEVVTGDLREPASYAASLPGCEALFHVAADYRLWAPDPADLYAINVEGTRGLLLAAARAGQQRGHAAPGGRWHGGR
jgi:dihydroflavonol-4-reductase